MNKQLTLEKRAEYNLNRKEARHRRGISIKYLPRLTEEQRLINKRIYKKIENLKRRKSGKVEIKIIQIVYEDNIKKFGTLTCYLCIKPIVFGNDHLEHKTPLSRGGTNDYDNLGIACAKCNLCKHNRTLTEWEEKHG